MLEPELREIFAASGCDGFMHVADVDGPAATGLEPDALVVSASVFKVAVALELFRRGAAGELDLRERIRVDPATSLGAPSGLSIFNDEVEVSLRDLAVSMLTVSDALATDVLVERLGLASVNALTGSLGLERTTIVDGIRSMFDRLAREIGFRSWREVAAHDWAEENQTVVREMLDRMRVAGPCDPKRANRTTPREMTNLLRLIWRDEAAPAEACAEVRILMGKQLQRERVARGFPESGVRFSGKTGSFGGAFRNEVGVVAFPDGGRYAVAVFTRAHRLYERGYEIDAAIAQASALAVASLRNAVSGPSRAPS
jgi:beta-lactamase class A